MRGRFILRGILVALFTSYLLASILGGIGLGSIAVHTPVRPLLDVDEEKARAKAIAESAEFRDVVLSTPDGVTLRGWFMRPRDPNGNAVILLHGVSDNRLGMEGYGFWLLKHHYSILLPDARSHGLSGGLASYGVKESDDIHQWVNWIEDNDHPDCVYGLGESMGASQLLQALPKEPRFCAVVAESPFATFREVAYARLGRQFDTGPWLGSTIFRPTVDVGLLYFRLKYGFDMEQASPARAVQTTNIPVLLIHGTNDTNIPPFHSEEIRARNPSCVTLWRVPGAIHTGAHEVAAEEFERRVLDWFTSHRHQF
jgi:hypothetical protein